MIRVFVGSLFVLIASTIVVTAFPLVSPFRHAIGVLIGPISPSPGNLGVVLGEFAFLAAASLTALLLLRFGSQILSR